MALYREPITLSDGTVEVGRAFCSRPIQFGGCVSDPSAIEVTRAASQATPTPTPTPTPEGSSSMLVNGETLRTLGIGFSAAFKDGFDSVPTFWDKVAMAVTSSTTSQEYGWLGLFPQVREWLGDRIVHSLAAQRYAIYNRDFELTISVPRNQIEDDNIGIFSPMFTEMGRGCKELPDKLIAELITGGFTTQCYDGQYFFDKDHPVLTDSDVQEFTSVSNFLKIDPPASAQGQPPAAPYPTWYLLDTSRSVRPFVLQQRRPFSLVSKTQPQDDNVFWKKEFVYGADGRCNAGYGFWQMAYAVQGPLNAANYEIARAAMTNLRGDHGHRLGIVPNVLLAPTTLERDARQLLKADRDQLGATNVWAGSADMILTPWL